MIQVSSEEKDDFTEWLRCWASLCRNVDNDIGYPKRVPFYTEPTGWPDEDKQPEASEDDWLQAERIASIVKSLEQRHPKDFRCLRARYRAMPNPPEPTKRYDHIEMSKREIYRACDRAQAMIEGALYA